MQPWEMFFSLKSHLTLTLLITPPLVVPVQSTYSRLPQTLHPSSPPALSSSQPNHALHLPVDPSHPQQDSGTYLY